MANVHPPFESFNSFFIHTEVIEQILTQLGHMIGSEWGLKMNVKNL